MKSKTHAVNDACRFDQEALWIPTTDLCLARSLTYMPLQSQSKCLHYGDNHSKLGLFKNGKKDLFVL
jgi:hypothetical protein